MRGSHQNPPEIIRLQSCDVATARLRAGVFEVLHLGPEERQGQPCPHRLQAKRSEAKRTSRSEVEAEAGAFPKEPGKTREGRDEFVKKKGVRSSNQGTPNLVSEYSKSPKEDTRKAAPWRQERGVVSIWARAEHVRRMNHPFDLIHLVLQHMPQINRRASIQRIPRRHRESLVFMYDSTAPD